MKSLKFKLLCAALAAAGGIQMAHAQCPTTPAAWSSTRIVDGGVLTITTGSGAAATTCKMTTTSGSQGTAPDGIGQAAVIDETPANEQRYRARFYVDATSLAGQLSGTQRVKVAVVQNLNAPCRVTPGVCTDTRARPAIMQVFLVNSAGSPRLGGFCRGSGAAISTAIARNQFPQPASADQLVLTSGWNKVEVEIVVGNAGTGACRLWLNGNTEGSPNWQVTGLTNKSFVEGVESFLLGAQGSQGDYFQTHGAKIIHFDEFESRRQTFISGP